MPPEPFPSSSDAGWAEGIQLQSIDPSRNRYRVYRLSWQPCLWGGGALVRSWGRRGTQGRSQPSFFPDEEQAQAERERILRVRARHGYQVVGGRRSPVQEHGARQRNHTEQGLQLTGGWWWLEAPVLPNRQLPLL